MDNARWEQIKSLFARANELPPPERAEFLRRECAGDDALLREVESLLGDHRADAIRTGGAADGIASSNTTSFMKPSMNEHVGTSIGKYKILQVIGEGGFGTVFLAEQSEPVRRRVALKIIKAGMDTRQVVARFDAERQALALMDHPHIARVFDGGATPETATGGGRPYFVMEYVVGDVVTRFADAHSLTLRARLDLFLQVCSAVQHAHTKGIIHRDLKPGNILVSMVDGKPFAKVIDFGIAKATAQPLTAETLFTQHCQLLGTPAYMSPEQAEGSQDIDTRTDVYSLGVLLYELLTGKTPIEDKRFRLAALDEVRRMIREEEPLAPSMKISRSLDTLVAAAAARKVEPARLSSLVKGELDWIVLKALDKDRSQRYETPTAFADDLRRHLTGEPVVAAPVSRAYRVRKFVRRNRGAVTGVGAVMATLLIGAAAFAWQAKVAGEQRDRARLAEMEVKQRVSDLKLILDFQAKMIQKINPTTAGEHLTEDVLKRLAASLSKSGTPETELTTTLDIFKSHWQRVNATEVSLNLIDRAILQPAAESLDSQFLTQPLVDAKLRQALASCYHELTLFVPAVPLQKRALEVRRHLLGEKHEETLESVNATGLLLSSQGKSSEAESYFREASHHRRMVLGDDHEDTLTSFANVGIALVAQGRFVEAEPYLREALEKRRRLLGTLHEDTLKSIDSMGGLLQAQGKLAEAEIYYREAAENFPRLFSEDHRWTLFSLSNLGNVLLAQNKLDEAEPYIRTALERRRRALGEEHQGTLRSLDSMGRLLQAKGDLNAAEPYLREALEKRRRVMSEEHRDTLTSIANYGALLQAQGKIIEAEGYLREALDKRRRFLTETHPDTLRSVNRMASLLTTQGKMPEVITLLAPSEVAARKAFTGAHASILASMLMNLGKAHLGVAIVASDFAVAEPYLVEAHEIFKEVRGEMHADTRECIRALVSLYSAWNMAEPMSGHDTKCNSWKAKLDVTVPPNRTPSQ
jgi:serine/threonine protein kinase/tetratricopeptide (TPR) repeat protein